MIHPRFIVYLINFVVSVVEFFITLRIILRLFGASATAPFVSWVYETTQPLLQPFEGMFPSPQLSSGYVLEFSALFALLFYAFVGYVLAEVISTLIHHSGLRDRVVEVRRR